MNKTSLITIAAMTILLSAGCVKNNGAESMPIGNFEPDDQPRAIHNMADAQASVGSRADGMLRPQHFTGSQLNSLGREKLIAMLNTPECQVEKLTVHLVLDPNDELSAERRDSVTRFLADAGLTEEHATIQWGANPRAWRPAAPQIARLPRTDSAGDDSESGSTADKSGGDAGSILGNK